MRTCAKLGIGFWDFRGSRLQSQRVPAVPYRRHPLGRGTEDTRRGRARYFLLRPPGLIRLVVSERERVGSFAPRSRRQGNPSPMPIPARARTSGFHR